MDDKNGYSILEVFWISFIALYLVVCIVSSLLFVFTPVGNLIISNMTSSNDSQFPFYSISLHVFFAGFLGGALFAARSLYKKLPIDGSQDGDDLDDRFEIKLWLFWYLFRPLQAGVLSLIIVALLNAGFIGLSNIKDPSTQSLYFQISIGFLVGYGTHEVLKKIEEIIKVTFSTSKSHQPVNEDESKEQNRRIPM